jgi:hypothetical protein
MLLVHYGADLRQLTTYSLLQTHGLEEFLPKRAPTNMAGGKNPDEIACWPTTDLRFMHLAVSLNVRQGVKFEDDPERSKCIACG